ncbi:lycopene cyclase domain-containing protein [Leptospira sp. 'Mane']|uniref:lycopene cyclase domain-containing protein n=1 Tax=Leptospira sp. 'Mane' TaxID=3387407 RepID=UPI00398B2170
MKILAICSIPFAFTEFLFYPTYWEPVFLFDMVDYIGFGIEDIMFVIGLSAFTSTAYPFFFYKTLADAPKDDSISVTKTLIIIFSVCFVFINLFIYSGIHMIYGAPVIMCLLSLGIMIRRNDLILSGLSGGILSMTVYAFLCYLLLIVYPDLFELTWHTENFLNLNIFKIPIEELIYGFASGCIATVFYPFVFHHRYVSIR